MGTSSYVEKVLKDRSSAGTKGEILAALYDNHSAAVFRLLAAMLGNRCEAEDALAEVFLDVGKRSPGDIRHMRAYLLKSARNKALQIMRKKRREIAFDPGHLVFFEGEGMDEERLLLAHRVEAALGELPGDQREVVVLKIYEELSFGEIAEITHCSINTASSRYRYALEKLRRSLEEA